VSVSITRGSSVRLGVCQTKNDITTVPDASLLNAQHLKTVSLSFSSQSSFLRIRRSITNTIIVKNNCGTTWAVKYIRGLCV